MFRQIKVRDIGGGWFEILMRETPKGAFTRIATAFGERRAERIADFLRANVRVTA